VNRSRTYFSVFLGIVILFVSYYVSQSLFFSRNNDKDAPISKIFSSGTTPKFAESISAGSVSNVNLTQALVSDISEDFYTKVEGLDAQGREDLFAQIKAGNAESLSFANVDPDTFAQQLTPELIGIRNEISDDEIKSDPKNDVEAYKKRYLLAVTDVQLLVSSQDAAGVLQSFMDQGDVSGLNAIVNAHRETYGALLDIPVPKNALEFHKKNLLYFSNSAAIYTALGQYQSDPLKGYLAVQYMGSIYRLWDEIYSSGIL